MRRSTRSASAASSSPHNLPPFYERARKKKKKNASAPSHLSEVPGSRRSRSTSAGWRIEGQATGTLRVKQEDDMEIKAEDDDDEDVDQLMSTDDHRDGDGDGDGREPSAANRGTPSLHFRLQRASLAPSGTQRDRSPDLGDAFMRSPGPPLDLGPAIKASYACRDGNHILDIGDTCAVKRGADRPPRFMWFKDDLDNDDSDSDVPANTQEESAGAGDRFLKEDDEDWLYARVIRPLFHRGDTQDKSPNSVPRAAGAQVHLYLRCPSDISDEHIDQAIRYPQLIKFAHAQSIEISEMIGLIARIVDQSDHTSGPHMLPMESNDIWSALTSDAATNIHLSLICLEDGCKVRQMWESERSGQIRYCRKCKIWLHVACLSSQPVTVDDIRRKDLVRFDQEYMSYLLDAGARKREQVEIKKLVLGQPEHKDLDMDVDDTLNRFPIPRSVRYEEVACIPIRRRTRPGFAPETNELFYQHAIDMVKAGKGRQMVRGADVATWLEGKAPGLGTRATKFILRKDLRKLRKDTIRRFLCTSCNAQIV
ncbi:uncharacterized protein SCHCODRAFT_01103821 [Schizophyllum commune H4-8]|nr:uncharacterized protein SCHCODRAFT_01103821 [Schizophyllum commune H4-8]KAI5887605.1 hypothetical protein SCHCODRAFT_01103821 [Schizophyllum commune H4-8]